MNLLSIRNKSSKMNLWFRSAALILIASYPLSLPAQQIDRKALVARHNLHITDTLSKGPTQVGNGHFAFGFDFTGLQTFNDDANTMSNWGWHKFPLPPGTDPYQYKGHEWDTQGRLVRYDVQDEKEHDLYEWMRANPQRLNLGRLGFVFKKKDGSIITLEEIENPVQDLNNACVADSSALVVCLSGLLKSAPLLNSSFDA